jgi:hypothetical protein
MMQPYSRVTNLKNYISNLPVLRSLLIAFSALAIGGTPGLAQVSFVNGLTLPGQALDLSGDLTSDRGRVGYFSDL